MVALGLPNFVLARLRARRINKFVNLFPNALDIIVRGVKAGLPLGDTLRIVSVRRRSRCVRVSQGQMHLHPLNTPVIEVAGDGQTARGIWISDGIEAGVPDGTPSGMNLWLKYCVDFKNMNGDWKIWHLNTYPIFMQTYDKPWQSNGPRGPHKPNPATEPYKADRPNNNAGLSMYNTSTVQRLDPAPPLPYETWDDSECPVLSSRL